MGSYSEDHLSLRRQRQSHSTCHIRKKNTVTQQVWGIIRFRSQNYWVQRDELYNILELLENNYHKEVELRHRRRQNDIRNENHLMEFQLENSAFLKLEIIYTTNHLS